MMKNQNSILLVLCALLCLTQVNAITYSVTTDTDPTPNGCQVGDCSLREAFIAANAELGFHNINLPAGDYVLSLGEIIVNASGGISLFGEGSLKTKIDASSVSRIFKVANTTFQIYDVYIINGFANGNGGAILSNNSNLALVQSVISHSQTGGTGGAIYQSDTEDSGRGLILNRTEIHTNIAAFFAAAVSCSANQFCTINDSTFQNNSSFGDFSSVIYAENATTFNMKNSAVYGNVSEDHTVSINLNDNVIIQNNTFSGNTVNSNLGTLRISNTNTANLTGNTLTHNDDTNTFRNLSISNVPDLLLNSNLIVNGCSYDQIGTITVNEFNLTSSQNCKDTFPNMMLVPINSYNLLPLSRNNGITPTHALGQNSVARNKQTLMCEGKDQRGISRLNPQCDVGAFQTENFCRTPNADIPDFDPTGGLYDVITINDVSSITDLDVLVDITHTYIGDLRITLTHNASGKIVTLMHDIRNTTITGACNGDNMNVIFDQDEIFNSIENTCEPQTGATSNQQAFPANFARYIPDAEEGDLLDIFDDESLAGDWTLRVIDTSNSDVGTLNRWCILPSAVFIDAIFMSGFE